MSRYAEGGRLFGRVAGQEFLRQHRELNFAVDPLQHPYLVKHSLVPVMRRVGDAKRFGNMGNLAVMPRDEYDLPGVLAAQNFFGERDRVVIREVVVDVQIKGLGERRDGFDGAIAVFAGSGGEEEVRAGEPRVFRGAGLRQKEGRDKVCSLEAGR